MEELQIDHTPYAYLLTSKTYGPAGDDEKRRRARHGPSPAKALRHSVQAHDVQPRLDHLEQQWQLFFEFKRRLGALSIAK